MEILSVMQLFELFSWSFLLFYVVYCFTQKATTGKFFNKEGNTYHSKRGVKRPRGRYKRGCGNGR